MFGWSFYRTTKTGFNVDYISRKWGKFFILNFLIFGAIFLLEKFVIEYLSRYVYSAGNLKNSSGDSVKTSGEINATAHTLVSLINSLAVVGNFLL